MGKVKDITKMNVKGQITIPSMLRKFYLKGSKFVGFKLTPEGILLVPLEIKEKTPYSEQEWKKIEKLSTTKGKIKKTAKSARSHIDSL